MATTAMNGSDAIHAAIDLGASSARLTVGTLQDDRLVVEEVIRLPNGPIDLNDGLHWDVHGLYDGMLAGLSSLCREGPGGPVSVGIDGWGGDYGMLGADGRLLNQPFHYRDKRTSGRIEQADRLVGARRIYDATGEHSIWGNTVYQLLAERESSSYQSAAQLLMIPDLFGYLLTGERRLEKTISSTTQLVDARTGQIVDWLLPALGLRVDLFAPGIEPGEALGRVAREVASVAGFGTIPTVVAVAAHDTASAVLGVPASRDDFAFVSSGTWSVVGLELQKPIITEDSWKANFANELGFGGTILFRKNVMGQWMLQECLRVWAESGDSVTLASLLLEAARCTPFRSLVNTADQIFVEPGNMPKRVCDACRRAREPVPVSRGELVRCVLDSVALGIAEALSEAQECSGREVRTVHIVGGGAANELFVLLVAAATGLEVIAGPVEATSIGNILVQLEWYGRLSGRAEMRAIVGKSFRPRGARPDPMLAQMAAVARERLAEIAASGAGGECEK